jgi:hypothetical protein
VFAPTIHCLILAVIAASGFAQPAGEPLPAQAKPVEGVLVPVPSEIFKTLDKFHDANWRAVQRPEVTRWKSHGDSAQVALLLGVDVAEGFIAMEAKDSAELMKIGTTVRTLARGLGVENKALRRSRSIIEQAHDENWSGARKEWDGVLADLEKGMIELKSENLSDLVSLSGWLRGTEALCTLVLQNYSPERAELIRQPALLDHLEKQLLGMRGELQNRPVISKMLDGIRKIRALVGNPAEPVTKETVGQINAVCRELVNAASQRPRRT